MTGASTSYPVGRGHDSRRRVGVAGLAGLGAAALTTWLLKWSLAPLVGWDTAALTLTAWTWSSIRRLDPAATGRHAAREVPGRATTDAVLLVAAVVSRSHPDNWATASRWRLA